MHSTKATKVNSAFYASGVDRQIEYRPLAGVKAGCVHINTVYPIWQVTSPIALRWSFIKSSTLLNLTIVACHDAIQICYYYYYYYHHHYYLT